MSLGELGQLAATYGVPFGGASPHSAQTAQTAQTAQAPADDSTRRGYPTPAEAPEAIWARLGLGEVAGPEPDHVTKPDQPDQPAENDGNWIDEEIA
jgi:hypothetical protein